MAVNRTIYTQGSVFITGDNTYFGTSAIGDGVLLSGVQSANFTVNSPKQDVNAFGTLGPINKVQVEPQACTLEVSLILNSGNSGDSNWLSGLAADASAPTPSGVTVTASGVGEIQSGIMTSLRMELAVGALPTLSMTFEGISGNPVMDAPDPPTTLFTNTIPVSTPGANFGTIWWSGATSTGCPQSIRGTWEMPVERINCLGNDINAPTVFSRPPGTMSFTAEGIDYLMIGTFVTGLQIGAYKMAQTNMQETSRTINMAIGEAAATFNVTSEGVALGAVILGA